MEAVCEICVDELGYTVEGGPENGFAGPCERCKEYLAWSHLPECAHCGTQAPPPWGVGVDDWELLDGYLGGICCDCNTDWVRAKLRKVTARRKPAKAPEQVVYPFGEPKAVAACNPRDWEWLRDDLQRLNHQLGAWSRWAGLRVDEMERSLEELRREKGH